jgi:hypothetical protein
VLLTSQEPVKLANPTVLMSATSTVASPTECGAPATKALNHVWLPSASGLLDGV